MKSLTEYINEACCKEKCKNISDKVKKIRNKKLNTNKLNKNA